MLVKEYIHLDAHELAHAIKSRHVSATEVLHCALQRVDEVNSQINAIVTLCDEFALQCLAQMKGNEPFYGVPLLVKDLGHAIAGVRNTDGSLFFSNNVSEHTSDLVSKLIRLGFVPFAKTNVPELGLSFVTESSLLGPCRNPYDLQRTAGGSSGGSAAAVASGVAPVATANDGGGSIRIPAACCGLFGFKPTTGLTPTGPLVGESWSGLATNFVLTRTVRDAYTLFNELVNPSLVNRSHHKPLNITYLEGAFASVPIAPSSLDAVNKIQELLQQTKHTVNKKYIELDLNGIGSAALIIIAANTHTVIESQQQFLGRQALMDELEPITWEFYHRGKALYAYELITAKNKLYQLLRPLHELFHHTDIVLTPALAQLPLLIGQLKTTDEFNHYNEDNVAFSPFTSLFNQAGLPAMTLPVMFNQHLPISIQMGAAKGNDNLLFSLAQELEALLPRMATVTPVSDASAP